MRPLSLLSSIDGTQPSWSVLQPHPSTSKRVGGRGLALPSGVALSLAMVLTAGCSDDDGSTFGDGGAGSGSTAGEPDTTPQGDESDGGGAGASTGSTPTDPTTAGTPTSAGMDGGETGGAGGETGGGDGADPFGCPIGGGGTRSGFHTFELTICDDSYNVQTNPWGGAEQTITAGGDNVFRVDAMQEPEGGEEWEVATFPSVFRGTSHGGDVSANSNLPMAVGDLVSVPTGFATNSSSIEFGGNSTYDVYFTDDEGYSGGAPDVYLMVWFFANALNPINSEGEGWSCRADPPTYIDSCTGAGSVMIGGKTFHRFIGPNGEATVISYAPETTFDTWEFDLKDFIDDAVSEGVLTEAMYLQGIQAGFEITTGGEGLAAQGFYAHINP